MSAGGERQVEEKMLAGLRTQSDIELAYLLRANVKFLRLSEAIKNEALARILERLPPKES